MESWLVTVISLVGSTAITTVIGLLIKHYFQKYMDRKDHDNRVQQERNDELQKLRDEKRRQDSKKDVMDCVNEVVKPLEEKIDAIDKKLDKVEDGTLSTLRNDILTCYYRCVDKGYHNDYDYQNIHHMYDSYRDLHGNSYVNDIIKRFDEDLPTKEIYMANKKKEEEKSEDKKDEKKEG